MNVRGNRATVQVTTDALRRMPAGGLATWASQLEALDCLGPGDGLQLANRIAESLPLSPEVSFQLLTADAGQTGKVDLGPETKLRVVSPLWREPGTGMVRGPHVRHCGPVK